MVERLRSRLEPECAAEGTRVVFHAGEDRTSHVPNYTAAIKRAVAVAHAEGATHVTLLPDDAILCSHFVSVLHRLIEQRPDDHLCLLSNHPGAAAAHAAGAVGYTTTFGSVLMGGTLRVEDWERYLDWRNAVLASQVPFDDGVNLWLASQGRRTFKPLPSLCEHDTTLDSMLGNQWQENDPEQRIYRHSAVFFPEADLRCMDWRPWDGEGMGHMSSDLNVPHLGHTFPRQCWQMVLATRPDTWDIEGMYREYRGGDVEENHVMLATPAYAGTELAMEQSRSLVERDLASHEVRFTRLTTHGDSLVTRGRHTLMHIFLMSPCSHLLMWDADIECLFPNSVRDMLATGYDVIGGAYPFRDGTGKVVANPVVERRDGQYYKVIESDDLGCIRVREVGTGFLMVSREAIIRLAMAHPELLYVSDMLDTRGAPMWALFDARIVDRRYLSEDYYFCKLWRDLGEHVYVYGPAKFRHWGKLPSDGHITTAWGLGGAEAAQ